MGSTNFNLDQSIGNYIGLIGNQGSLTASDTLELTGHLHDATEALQKTGLSEEEAFVIACKRLGSEQTLTEEYSKVNYSVSINKIWAYLFIGFNLLYALPKLMFIGIALFYFYVKLYFGVSTLATVLVTVFHLLFIVLIWYIVQKKDKLSRFVEKQVNTDALKVTVLSFAPWILIFGIHAVLKKSDFNYLTYPIYHFNSRLTEVTLYMAALSIIAGVSSLIFSLKHLEKLSLYSLFHKPSLLFLVCYGIFVELLAACTRAIDLGEYIVYSAVLFGLIYFIATFKIAYYNNKAAANKLILVFSLPGLMLETIVGIQADLARGNTYYTLFFVTSMLISIVLGKILGSNKGKQNTAITE